MRLSRTITYAIRATLELADAAPNCPIACSELASRGNMPPRFLVQILRSLVSQGVLCSTQGMAGGYSLARPPNTVTLLDIVQAFENPLRAMVPELPGVSAHVRERLVDCVLKTSAAASQVMNALTLADLTQPPRDLFETRTDCASIEPAGPVV